MAFVTQMGVRTSPILKERRELERIPVSNSEGAPNLSPRGFFGALSSFSFHKEIDKSNVPLFDLTRLNFYLTDFFVFKKKNSNKKY